MSRSILVLPGDGIGPEITAEAVKVIGALNQRYGLDAVIQEAPIGGAAVDSDGVPLPERTLAQAQAADAVLFGAVGGPAWDALPREQRPERGLLAIRAELGLFANLRPAILYPQLAGASALRPEVVAGLDIMIVRELTGGLYFGQPRGLETLPDGERRGVNTLTYTESEVERIGRLAFAIAGKRSGRLCSVDKANVLEVSELWRQTIERLAADYPDCVLTHMYVDNAAMQLVRAPKQFDTVVTGNLFGDVLSDCAAMLTGSIGMLPSASLDAQGKGLYEPCHGAAPDIAGEGIANPLAAILSAAMLLRYSLDAPALASRVEAAVSAVLDQDLRTADIHTDGMRRVGTAAMGDAVVAELAGAA